MGLYPYREICKSIRTICVMPCLIKIYSRITDIILAIYLFQLHFSMYMKSSLFIITLNRLVHTFLGLATDFLDVLTTVCNFFLAQKRRTTSHLKDYCKVTEPHGSHIRKTKKKKKNRGRIYCVTPYANIR